jgi:hypothetical protein
MYEGKGRDFRTTLMGYPKIALDGHFSTQTASRKSLKIPTTKIHGFNP